MKRESRINAIIKELKILYPHADCELLYQGIPERLVIATILSAQTTDKAVNKVTPELWRRYPVISDLAAAEISDVEEILKTIGLFRNKAGFIVKAAKFMTQNHLPKEISELIKIPGVGRKTANVVMGVIYKKPSITVDTHVKRLSGRLGLSENKLPEKIEYDLKEIIPIKEQTAFSHRLIHHGRQVCKARKPLCISCSLCKICPSCENGSPQNGLP